MIIFGTRGYLQVLAMVNFICTNCHNPAAQKVVQRIVRFTLFFIPLFPISKSYSTTCTFCGLTSKINKEQADQYVAYGAQQQAQYRAPAQEQIPSGQQWDQNGQPHFPAQQFPAQQYPPTQP